MTAFSPYPACRFGPVWFVALMEDQSVPKIIVNAFLTLDGVMQAPGGPDEEPEGGFSHGGWQATYDDDATGRLVTEGFADVDGFLLGRKTYDIFANYWPKVTVHRDRAQLAAKVRDVARPRACHLEQLQADQGRHGRRTPKLRQAPGRTLHTWGSADALQTLLKNDLIDEYRLFLYPLLLGSGKRLFGSGTIPVALKQVESVTTSKGTTYHRFERSGKPEYGQIGT